MQKLGLWLTSCIAGFFSLSVSAAEVKVAVQGLTNEDGQFLLAIYKDADSFLDGKKALKEVKVKVAEAKAGIIVSDLAPGTYALAVIHDQNSNDKLDTNFIGIPKEPFGTSLNAPSRFGPPSFEQSKFELKDSLELAIQLKSY